MTNRGIVSQISLTGQDGFDWSISQNVLLVNDWLTSHRYLTLFGVREGRKRGRDVGNTAALCEVATEGNVL